MNLEKNKEIFLYHNFGLILLNAPHQIINREKKYIITLLKKYRALFIRYNLNWDIGHKKPFWYVIKDNFDGFEELSSNTRNQIRKGQKNFEIRKIDYKVILDYGYEIYRNSYNIKNSDISEKKFKEGIIDIKGERKFWGIYTKDNILVGYCFIRLIDNTCNYSHIKIHKDYIKMYPMYVLIYELNKYYLEDEVVLYINAGAKSLSHETKFQELLINKFKFRKAYCDLEVKYRKSIKMIINILFPIRVMFNIIPLNLFKKIAVLLEQEKIRRECKIHH